MSPDVITLRPEVEEILREVAKRPGSGLLRVARKDVVRTVLERRSLVHARSATLTSVERELVRAHREEVAFALRQAAYRQLAEGPYSREQVIDRAIPSRAREIPSARTIQSTAVSAAREGGMDADVADALELLAACVGEGGGRKPSAATLAAASHRLVPTLATRIYAAAELRQRGAPRVAATLLVAALPTSCDGESARTVWSNLADAFLADGDNSRAHRAASAVEARSDRDLGLLFNRLLSAVRVQNMKDARACVVAFDAGDICIHGLGTVPDFLRERKTRGSTVMQAADTVAFRELRNHAGPNGEEILNALVE